jgi:hypothetical protein
VVDVIGPLPVAEANIVAEAVQNAVRAALLKPSVTYEDAARVAHDAVLDALSAVWGLA